MFVNSTGKSRIIYIMVFYVFILFALLAFSGCGGKETVPDDTDSSAVLMTTPEDTDAPSSSASTPGQTPEQTPAPTPSQAPSDAPSVTPTDTQTQTTADQATPGSTSGNTAGSTPKPRTPGKTPTPTPTKAPTPKPAPTPSPTPAEKYNGNKNFTDGKIIRFSHPSGFYPDAFTLKLDFDPAYTVYYTTDGSEPTSSSEKYTSGINIKSRGSATSGAADRVNIIRAAAFKGGKKQDQTVTATYIVNSSAGSFKGRYNDLAVVSISTDKTNLYGPDGIFTNYTVHGRESERPVHIEFFDSDGTAGFSVDAGMRVYGGTSRANPQKSLKITARKEYDPENGKFKYAMLPDSKNLSGKPVDRFDSFILRAGGNDTLFGDANRTTLLRDALVHTLAGRLSNIAFQAYRPVAVYINGRYAGLYNLRDDTDNDYLEQHYGVPKDKVAIVAYGHENGSYFYKVDEGTDADITDYVSTLQWIASNDMTKSSNYKKACTMIDPDNYIKFVAVNVYANNRDWPHNNMRMWKYTGTPNSSYGQDGRWRFILKDIDFSWGWIYAPGDAGNVVAEELAHNRNVLSGRADSGDHPFSAAFASLMRNSEFKAQFISFMKEMTEKWFSSKTALDQISKMEAAAEKEMKYVISNRWYADPDNPSAGTFRISARSVAQWKKAVDTLETFARERPGYINALMKELYG